MYGTDMDDQSDTIYPKQSDQDDHPNRSSRCEFGISMI